MLSAFTMTICYIFHSISLAFCTARCLFAFCGKTGSRQPTHAYSVLCFCSSSASMCNTVFWVSKCKSISGFRFATFIFTVHSTVAESV